MSRRRLGILLGIVGSGLLVALFYIVAPERFDAALEGLGDWLSGVPSELVLGVAILYILAVWIAAMMLLAKFAYWGWCQIDDYVWRTWNLLLPESPLIRFAVGIMLMIFVFVIGPLVVIQALDLVGDEDPDPINETNAEENETEADDEQPLNETTQDRLSVAGPDALTGYHLAAPRGTS